MPALEINFRLLILIISALIMEGLLKKSEFIKAIDSRYQKVLRKYLRSLFYMVNGFFLLISIKAPLWVIFIFMILILIDSFFIKRKIGEVDENLAKLGFYFNLSIMVGFLINGFYYISF